MITINASLRIKTGTQKSRNLRSSNQCPAIVYGKQFIPIPINFPYKKIFNIQDIQFLKNKKIILIINNNIVNKIIVKIQEIQYHPFKPKIIHIDFMHI